MKLEKKILAGLLGVGLMLQTAPIALAADNAPQQSAATTNAATADNIPDPPEQSYEYTSKKYGYKMTLPHKPIAVIPASALNPDKSGDIIIFKNKEYNILYAWAVYYNDFKELSVPNFNKMDTATETSYLSKLKDTNPYESVKMVNLSKKNKAVLAVTAKTFYIDTNDDGVGDTEATADSQNAELFFRANKGGRFRMELIDKPELRQSSIDKFIKGAESFKEL